MSEKRVGEMDDKDFMELVHNFIETQSGSDDPLPGETFFELWAEIERERKPVEIQGMIVEGKLVFLPPAHADVPLFVRENEIAIGGHVVRVNLVEEE